ncbi:HDOD domain protein [Leptospira interrogans serovar Bataviae str. HAI135]|nr:HDOD domain protein [Leptospira interrogans serovar Bataviae str. HAI135]
MEIEGLPPLPNTLTRIISLCNNPDSDLGIIASEIEKNPALSVDLLKLSNSAGFASRNKVNTIVQAVKVVGLEKRRNLLYVSGVRKSWMDVMRNCKKFGIIPTCAVFSFDKLQAEAEWLESQTSQLQVRFYMIWENSFYFLSIKSYL